MINVEKIYVVHYTKLVERRQKLSGIFRQHGLTAEYIFDHDKEQLTEETLKAFYTPSEENYNNTILKAYGAHSDSYRTLNDAEISCTLKHYVAIQKIGRNCQDYGLVFEDDVLLVDDFVTKFNLYLEKTPSDWDAVFMGSCCDLKLSDGSNPDQIAYLKDHPASKCGDGYLLRSDLARKITKTMKPFNTISDWELGYQLYLHDAKVYWWEPPLLCQGSETGLFQSTLECSRCGRRGCNGDCNDNR